MWKLYVQVYLFIQSNLQIKPKFWVAWYFPCSITPYYKVSNLIHFWKSIEEEEGKKKKKKA